MKTHCVFFPVSLLALFASAEPRSAPETQSSREVESTRVIQNKGRTITIQRIKPPSGPEASPTTENQGVTVVPSQDATSPKEPISFTVSATVIDEKTTMLEWRSHDEQQKIISFSNLDWRLFGGFQTFEDDERSYTTMIFARSITRSDFDELDVAFPDHLPAFEDGGARYTVLSEGGISPAASSFLEAVHSFYDQEEENIKQTHAKREKEREERERELRENPPKPQDVVIQFWKREPNQETPTE